VARRFIVYGAGAVGGVIAARLHLAGLPVVVIARGQHLAAIQRDGLTLETPDRTVTVPIPALASPAELDWSEDDTVLLTVKSQDTERAVADLAAVAPPSLVVICGQNGVANEPTTLRRFENTLAMWVIIPATHLVAGVVRVEAAPCPGIVDVGRYPRAADAAVEEMVVALRSAGFDSRGLADVMRWKYAKLLMNLTNAVEAICATPARDGVLARAVREEGVACLEAAGIPYASPEEEALRRGDLIRLRPVNGEKRGGSSTWQSLARHAGTSEVDYLNGEIVLLGRLHGVPAPANQLVQRLANRMTRERAEPRSLDEAALLAELSTRRGAAGV